MSRKPATNGSKGAASLSHWIDETLPDALRVLLVANKIDPEQFAAHVAPAVGRYRSEMHVRANTSQVSEDAGYVHRLREKLDDLQTLLCRGTIPARVIAGLGTVLLRIDVNVHEVMDRLDRDALTVSAALVHVERALDAQTGKRGRKPEASRAALLRAIVSEIQRQTGLLKRSRIIGLEALEALSIESPNSAQRAPDKAAARASKRRVQK